MSQWHNNKLKENNMIREGIDKKWLQRIKDLNLLKRKAGYIYDKLIQNYPDDKTYLRQKGYSLDETEINEEYIGKLLTRYKTGELKL